MHIPTGKFLNYSFEFVIDLLLTAGSNAIVTIVDWLINWVTPIPCHMGPNHPLGEEEVDSLFFYHIVCHFGIPHFLVYDQDARFISEFWTQLWQLVGTRTIFSSAHHPQTEG